MATIWCEAVMEGAGAVLVTLLPLLTTHTFFGSCLKAANLTKMTFR